MLREWPIEHLGWWSCLPDRDRRFGQEVALHRTARIPARLYPQRRWTRAKSWLMDAVWARWAATHLLRMIREYQPDVIWTIPHLWSVPPLAAVLPQAAVPFHVSVHDFVDAHGMAERIGPERCAVFIRQVEDLYAAGTTCDTICAAMAEDFRQRTSRDADQILRAGIEEEDFSFLAQKVGTPGPVLRIAYAGSILVEKEFALFVAALAVIRPQLPRPVELHLFGSHPFSAYPWFDDQWMRERGNLAAEPLTRALRECDWGFSPMSVNDGNDRYNRFSFPTKFISYLAAGLPVIVLGHRTSSVVEMARRYETGVCSEATAVGPLGAALLPALSDTDPWSRYREEMLRCARAEFDAGQMRQQLYRRFSEARKRVFDRKHGLLIP
jgi:glycosyltransferase involved in cell wall biosynthesis